MKIRYFYCFSFLLISHLSSATQMLFVGNLQGTPYYIRQAVREDESTLFDLYKKVASISGRLARTAEEITPIYVHETLLNGIHNGLALVVEYNGVLIGCMIKYRKEPKIFAHVLTEGSILIDPEFQGRGIGSNLIQIFLKKIIEDHAEILRVELMVRESNPAIRLYRRLGFIEEGKFEQRIRTMDGRLEADIPMTWTNPNFCFYQ